MSIFSNPKLSSKGTSFAPRITTPGQYIGCECIKFEELPEGGKALAVLEWKVPNSAATIQDFIQNPENDKTVDYIIGHAKELANSALDRNIPADEEKDLAWAERVFNKVAQEHSKCDVIITIRSNPNPNGNDYVNVRYVKARNVNIVEDDDI